MFTENKYSKYYFRIIENRQRNPLNGYVEKHHIIPKSLGGTNKKSNIVALSAREHFLCHRLLVKMTIGKDRMKMSYAIRCLMHLENTHQQRYKINARTYQTIILETKSSISENISGQNNPFYGQQHSPESKAIMRAKRALQVMPSKIGKTYSEETLRKWRDGNRRQFQNPDQIECRKQKTLQQMSDPKKRYAAGKGSRGTRWCHNPITGQRMKYRINMPDGYINGTGVIKRKTRKKSGKSWYNNPITGEHKQFIPGTESGEFVRGRIIKKKGGAL
jgi:hypothetical protein